MNPPTLEQSRRSRCEQDEQSATFDRRADWVPAKASTMLPSSRNFLTSSNRLRVFRGV